MVSEYDYTFYSGMLPAACARLYEPSQLTKRLPEICRYFGAAFTKARVVRLGVAISISFEGSTLTSFFWNRSKRKTRYL